MSKSNSNHWKFNGPLQLLRQRAFLLSVIRKFFVARNVLEVETPVLSSAANTDVEIDMFTSQTLGVGNSSSYLRTSPEFFHKRLLASGVGDLFEIAKVFRYGEKSQLHNPEFTLLEWYRLDFELFDLIDEVIELIQFLRAELGDEALVIESISYQALFERYVDFNPFEISLMQLRKECHKRGYVGSELSHTEALDFIFAVVIQPLLESKPVPGGKDSSVFEMPPAGLVVYHFPVEMAALAQVHPESPDRCLRFEFLWGGVELANGYQELTDAVEQQQRFEQDNENRIHKNKPPLPIDQNLISALAHGMPKCSGVALGIERLMMCLLGHQSIDDVMGFSAENS